MALESIALIPSGYKATKVYSQLPVNGNGDFTFDRGTSADQTRVNKNGLIEDVAQDVPRLDYLDGGCPSLLLEPSSTNLITYSEEFDNPAWTKTLSGTGSAPIVTANQGLSPDGSLNADRVQFSLNGGVSSSDSSILFQNTSVSSSATTSKSVYIKSNDANNYNLNFYDSISGGYKAVVAGQEWVRVELTNAVPSTTSGLLIGLFNFGGVSVDDTADILVWGAQLEEQSYATSYIPTSGRIGQRAAETCNGAGTTAEINSQEGVLFVEISIPDADGTGVFIALSDGSISNRVVIGKNTSATDIVNFVTIGGSSVYVGSALNFTENQYYKIAIKWKDSDFDTYVNGLNVASQSSGSSFSSGVLNELAFDNGGGGSDFYGRVKRLSVYDSALSTTELEELTGFSSFAEMQQYLNYA